MAYTAEQVNRFLRALLPPGAEDLYDFLEGSVGDLWMALADAWKAHGYDPVEQLAANVNPLTCDADTIALWEVVTGFSASRIAAIGSLEQRRAQVLSKLREFGPTSLPNVRAIVGPLLGYADPTQLVIVERDRAALTALNTYALTAHVEAPGGGTYQESIFVPDQTNVSRAGPTLDINITTTELADLHFSLISPGAVTFCDWDFSGLYSGAAVARAFKLRNGFNDLATPVGGTWTFQIVSANAGYTLHSGSIFVEGIGRTGFTSAQGLGRSIYEWGVEVDTTLEGVAATSDRLAAWQALQRIKQAHTVARLFIKTGAGGACWIPNISLPAQMFPCA